MDDNAIIELFFARDEGAIRAASREYGAYCAAIARNILDDRGAAEECVNDAWLRCWQSIPPQRPKSLKAYGNTIALANSSKAVGYCAGAQEYRRIAA